MKAKVKATGEIVEVVRLDECIRGIFMYKTTEGNIYTKDCLEFDYYNNPDYWTRLKHQFAGMAMQGIIASNLDLLSHEIIEDAIQYAHALVEKLKKEEKK